MVQLLPGAGTTVPASGASQTGPGLWGDDDLLLQVTVTVESLVETDNAMATGVNRKFKFRLKFRFKCRFKFRFILCRS